MSTEQSNVRGGIKIRCNTSQFPAPRPRGASPIPAFQDAESSHLNLSLMGVVGSYISDIQVNTGPLPGGSACSWTLSDQCYPTGTTPDPLPNPIVYPVTLQGDDTLTFTVHQPLAGADHNIWLTRTDAAGKVTVFPSSPITTPPDLTKTNVDAAVNAADQAQQIAAEAQSSADAATAAIASITSDNILSRGEKSAIIQDYAILTGEQAGIDAQANAYGINWQKTFYDNAVSALVSYMGGLNSPTAWSDTSGDTNIVGATFRQKFQDVYSTRQTLLNAIYAAAKALADAAQATANTAQGAAAAAQAAANNAMTSATTALTGLGYITSDSILSAGAEKSEVIRDYTALTGAQSGIDAQAVSFLGPNNVLQQAYDASLMALTSYLNGLSPAWNDVSQNTPIVGATLRSKFTDVYNAQQILLNAIYAQAKALADNAQSTATLAVNNAAAAQSTATSANTAAAAAQTSANTANSLLSDMASDAKLTPLEKSQARGEWDVIAAEQPVIVAEASSFGVSTTNYTNAFQALAGYLNNGVTWSSGVPNWLSDASLGTTNTIIGVNWRAYWADYYSAKTAILNAISTAAKTLANTAQNTASGAASVAAAAQSAANAAQATANTASANASSALTQLTNLASDNILSAVEKPSVIENFTRIVAEESGIATQGQAYGVSISAYETSITTLSNYLNGLISPTAWNDTSGDTNIDGPTFRSNFGAVYAARQALLNSIYAAAQTLATNAQNTANAVTAKLAALAGNAVNMDPNCTQASYWGIPAGNLVTITDGKSGPTAIQCSTMNGVSTFEIDRIPVDPNRTYRVRCYGRTISGSPRFYLVVGLWDSNGNVIAGDGTYWYYPASNVYTSSPWTQYIGVFGSRTGKPIPPNAATMSIGVLMCYQTSGVQQVQGLYIEDVTESYGYGIGSVAKTANVRGSSSGGHTAIFTADNIALGGSGITTLNTGGYSATLDLTVSGPGGFPVGFPSSGSGRGPVLYVVPYAIPDPAGGKPTFSITTGGTLSMIQSYLSTIGLKPIGFLISNGNITPFTQTDNHIQFTTPITICSGSQGNPSTGTYVAQSLGGVYLPYFSYGMVAKISLRLICDGASTLMVAPNSGYGSATSNTRGIGIGSLTGLTSGGVYDLVLESDNIYVSSSGTTTVQLLGCTLNI